MIRMIYIGSQRVTLDIIAISSDVFISRRDFRCVSITLVLCPCQCCESRGRLVSRRRPNGQSVVKETIVASWHPALTPLLCIFRRPSLDKGILTSGITPRPPLLLRPPIILEFDSVLFNVISGIRSCTPRP